MTISLYPLGHPHLTGLLPVPSSPRCPQAPSLTSHRGSWAPSLTSSLVVPAFHPLASSCLFSFVSSSQEGPQVQGLTRIPDPWELRGSVNGNGKKKSRLYFTDFSRNLAFPSLCLLATNHSSHRTLQLCHTQKAQIISNHIIIAAPVLKYHLCSTLLQSDGSFIRPTAQSYYLVH